MAKTKSNKEFFKACSIFTDQEGNNAKPSVQGYFNNRKNAESHCRTLDVVYSRGYSYRGSVVYRVDMDTSEETEVYSSPFREETERKQKEQWEQRKESSERESIREEEERKEKTRREKLLESWGITEDDVSDRNFAKEVETNVCRGELELRKKALIEAKKNLKDLLFNYEKLIEEAKMKVEEENKKLDKVLNNPKIYEKWSYNKETGKSEMRSFSVNDLGDLWAKAGGKDKWEKINLKKMGPLPVRE